MRLARRRAETAWIDREQIITGERLQSLVDLSLVSRESYEFHRGLAEQVPRLVVYDDPSELDLPDLSRRRSLFVYTHKLGDFRQRVWPGLEGSGHVLVTHNSDHEVGEAARPLLDDPRLRRWFAQNALIDHPKLMPLPIGIANSMWKHGNLDTLHRAIVAAQGRTPDKLVLLHFNPSTHPSRRAIWDALRANFPHMPSSPPPPRGYRRYLAELARHRFCVAPRGNGVDTHRVWECLYLGVVPIVERSTHTEHWERLGLDVLVIDDWAQVTPAFLEARAQQAGESGGHRDPLRLSYYAALLDGATASTDPAR